LTAFSSGIDRERRKNAATISSSEIQRMIFVRLPIEFPLLLDHPSLLQFAPVLLNVTPKPP
jgi:hypothetical protein